MSDSIELTLFNDRRLTVFKRWITAVKELPAHTPVPRTCSTLLIGANAEEIQVQEGYEEIIAALNN